MRFLTVNNAVDLKTDYHYVVPFMGGDVVGEKEVRKRGGRRGVDMPTTTTAPPPPPPPNAVATTTHHHSLPTWNRISVRGGSG